MRLGAACRASLRCGGENLLLSLFPEMTRLTVCLLGSILSVTAVMTTVTTVINILTTRLLSRATP